MFHWVAHLGGAPAQQTDTPLVTVGCCVYAFEGQYLDYARDKMAVHVFNTVSLRWTTLLPPVKEEKEKKKRRREGEEEEGPLGVPPSRDGHTAVLIDGTVYVWGGRALLADYRFLNELYAFDVDARAWFKAEHSGAAGRRKGWWGHSACVVGKVMYVCGGVDLYGFSSRLSHDLCKLDTATMLWSVIDARGTPPSLGLDNGGHSATVIGTKMFVFVNKGSHVAVFDTKTDVWLSIDSSEHRLFKVTRVLQHSAFSYNGELYVFCCRRKRDCRRERGSSMWAATYGLWPRPIKDLWRFSPETFSWKMVEPNCPQNTSSMSCCMVGDRVILFEDDDLYILDLNPSLKTLCKLAVIQYGLEPSGLPHNIRWELAAMANQTVIP